MKSTRVLVIGTSGILNDGVTTWMRQTFGAMDLTGLEPVTVAFEGCDPSIMRGMEDVGFRVVSLPSRKTSPWAYMAAYRDLLKEGGFDVVHVCSSSATSAFELHEARRSAVGMRIAHSHSTQCEHRIMDRMLRPILYHEATDFYACGSDAGKWLFGDIPFTVIPNGKNVEEFAFSAKARDEMRGLLGFEADALIVGHVGRFNEPKNHSKLIEIFAELHSRSQRFRLVLVGDGALVEAIQQKASDLGILNAVNFLGRREDVPRLLSAMDIMVFPSLYEGFPNVVLEWQLNGLPVVMSDTITDECVISPLVSQVSPNAASAEWAHAIGRALEGRNRIVDSDSACCSARAQGYEIRESAAMLRRLYLQGIELCR